MALYPRTKSLHKNLVYSADHWAWVRSGPLWIWSWSQKHNASVHHNHVHLCG